jgi:hypothetical protein
MPEEGQPDGQQLTDDDSSSAVVHKLLHGTLDDLPTEWEQSGKISEFEDRYFGTPDGYRWFWKTPVYTYGCGIPAILGILGQFALPALDHILGRPLGDSVDMVRTVMMFGGFFLLMIASPVYRPTGWKPAEDVKNFMDRESFKSKFKR